MAMKKLGKEDYLELDFQFSITPDPADATASGEHYALVAILNRFGYYPHSRQEAYDTAQELLALGWEGE